MPRLTDTICNLIDIIALLLQINTAYELLLEFN